MYLCPKLFFLRQKNKRTEGNLICTYVLMSNLSFVVQMYSILAKHPKDSETISSLLSTNSQSIISLSCNVRQPIAKNQKCSAALHQSVVPHYTIVQCRTTEKCSAALHFSPFPFVGRKNNYIFAEE